MDADGSSQTQLTDDLTRDFEPDVSAEAQLPPADAALEFLASPTAFPTSREALLLSYVPQRTRQTCTREDAEDMAASAIAGVTCSVGQNTVFYDLFRMEAAMRRYYARNVANAGATRDQGFCRTDEVSEGVWTLDDVEAGRLLCFTSSQGTRVAVWTHEQLKIVAWAQRPDGNRGALYRFWSGPNAGPVG
jgi:hypothetical protein